MRVKASASLVLIVVIIGVFVANEGDHVVRMLSLLIIEEDGRVVTLICVL